MIKDCDFIFFLNFLLIFVLIFTGRELKINLINLNSVDFVNFK